MAEREARDIWREFADEVQDADGWRPNAYELASAVGLAACKRIAELEAELATQRSLADMLRSDVSALERMRDSAFRAGWEKGVRDFAIWRNGEQLVGCLRRPLAEVLKRGPSDA